MPAIVGADGTEDAMDNQDSQRSTADWTATGFAAIVRNMQTFTDEISRLSRVSFAQNAKLIDELSAARDMSDLVAIQAKFMTGVFERFNEQFRLMAQMVEVPGAADLASYLPQAANGGASGAAALWPGAKNPQEPEPPDSEILERPDEAGAPEIASEESAPATAAGSRETGSEAGAGLEPAFEEKLPQEMASEHLVSHEPAAAPDPAEDVSIAFDDPDLAIPWPLPVAAMSPRDRVAPPLTAAVKLLT